MKTTRRLLSVVLCVLMVLSMMSSFTLALDGAVQTSVTGTAVDPANLDYDALRQGDDTFIINGAWTDEDLIDGSELSYYFKGNTYTETYDASRHFNTWANAYAVYSAKLDETNIGSYVPTFIFAPGTYDETIVIRGNGIILGANAGVSPNDASVEWDYKNMAQGWAANSAWDTANQTVLKGGIFRGTRTVTGAQEGPFQYYFEQYEKTAGEKSTVTAIADGIVFTGTKGFYGQDYDINNDVQKPDGSETIKATGGRTEYKYLINSLVSNWSGNAGADSGVFAFWDTSAKINHAIAENVRFDGISGNGLMVKYIKTASFKNCSFNNISAQLLGGDNSAFGRTATYAVRDTDVSCVFDHCTFTNGGAVWSMFQTGIDYDSEKYNTATTFNDSIFYNPTTNGTYGMFLPGNKSTKGAEVTLNVTNNQIYFGNYEFNAFANIGDYQRATVNYNVTGNKIVGKLKSFIGNSVNTGFGYVNADVRNNYIAANDGDEGVRPASLDGGYPANFKNGFDFSAAPYYLDSEMTILNTAAEITAVNVGESGASGASFDNDTHSVAFDLKTGDASSVEVVFGTAFDMKYYTDSACTNETALANYSFNAEDQKAHTLYLKISNGSFERVYTVTIKAIAAEPFATAYESTKFDAANAVMLDRRISGVATGSEYIAKWDGSYYTFTVGVNIFATQADIAAAGKSGTTVLVTAADADGNFCVSIPGDFYTEAFDTVPYIKGTALDGSDWTENAEFASKALDVNNIWISGNFTGKATVAGFVMKGRYFDITRTSATTGDITVKNIIVNGTYTTVPANITVSGNEPNGTYVFRMGNGSIMSAAGNDKFNLVNCYVKKSSSGYRLMGEWCAKETVIDGMYVNDLAAAGLTGKSWIKQAADGSSFTIKNSNLRSFKPSAVTGGCVWEFCGNNGKDRGSETHKIIIDSNILDDFAMQTGGDGTYYIMRWQEICYSDVDITNNYISSRGNTKSAPTSVFHTANINQTQINVNFSGNVINGGVNNLQIDAGSKYAPVNFTIIGNYLSTVYKTDLTGVEGVGIGAVNHGVTANDNPYYLDYTRTCLNTDMVLTNVSAGSSEATNVTFDDSAKTIGFTLASGSSNGMVYTFANPGVTTALYSDADCNTSVNDIVFDINKGGANVYYLKATYGKYSRVYTVIATFDIPTSSISEFSDGELTIDDVVFLDTSIADGTSEVSFFWKGKKYDGAVVGTNIFSTLDAIQTANLTDKAVLVINHYNGWFEPKFPGRFYTQAWDTVPYVKGTAQDGSDWTYNEGYAALTVTVSNIRVAPSGSESNFVGKESEYAGFTVTGNIYDNTRPVSAEKTTVKFTNCLKDGTSDQGYFFQVGNSNAKNADNIDELYIKNLYIKRGNNWRLIGENVPATTMFDGLFCDANAAGHINNASWIKGWSKNNVFTVKNSCLRNWVRNNATGYMVFQPYSSAAIADGYTSKLVFDNNILYNFVSAVESDGNPDLINWVGRGHTGLEITNNYIEYDYETAKQYNSSLKAGMGMLPVFWTSGTPASFPDGGIKIVGNTLNNWSGKLNFYFKTALDVHDNFLSKTHVDDLTTVIGTPLVSLGPDATIANQQFYVNYENKLAGTIDSDVIYPMTVNGQDYTAADLAFNASGSSVFDLKSQLTITNDYNNVIGYYTDAELETPIADISKISVPAVGMTVYMAVTSPDATAMPYVVGIVLEKDAKYVVGVEKAYEVVAKDDILNQISWRGLITAEGTYAIDYISGTGTAVNDGTRVGIIYMRDISDLDLVKAALEKGASSIDDACASVNETYADTTRAYAMSAKKTISWNDEKQAYSYVYKFNVKPDETRTAVMYVVYEDEDGNTCITFSDMLEQTATLPSGN